MKNRYLKQLLSLLAVLVLLFTFSASVYAAAPAPSITQNLPETVSVPYGQPYTLKVELSVTDNVQYQWYSSNGVIAGADKAALTAEYTKNTTVWCQIMCGDYVATSRACNITVTAAATPTPTPTAPVSTPTPTQNLNPTVSVYMPSISKQPSSAKLSQGQSTTLSVTASCPNLGSGLALQYQWYISASNSAATATPIPNATSASYTTSPTAGDKYYLVAVWSTNGKENSAVAYSNIVSVSYGSNEFKITKHPTGETVKAGESALFIARADNAVKREWRIVSKDTTQTVPANQAAYYFKGLVVSGENTESLSLSNIPAEMNGWSVECKFTALDGRTLFTNGAILDVRSAVATPSPVSSAAPTAPVASPAVSAAPVTETTVIEAPVISSQPSPAVLSENETVELKVAASGADAGKGVTLKYQWYRNSQNSNANGTAISGATRETYIPDTISGSRYYYVGITATDGSNSSKTVYSDPVTVTYTAPISSSTPSPTEQPDRSGSSREPGLTSMIIGPIIAIVLAASAIGVGVFFLLRGLTGKKESRGERYYDSPVSYYDDDYDNKR